MKIFQFHLSSLIKQAIHVGNNIKTLDITGTPITSPVTITAGATKTLLIPANAAEIVINSDNDVMFSEHSSFSSYDRIPAGIPENIGIVRRDNLYLKNTGAGSIVVYFHFVIL